MIQFIEGNLLESKAEALVNTVNTVGVMGKGIALQFKNQYPNNYKLYEKACKAKEIQVGKLFVTEDSSLLEGRKIIINFPTKYEPNAFIREAMKKERVKLTPARAMLLSVLYDLVRNGEFVSEFAAEKAAYFLQRFGTKKQFKLEFQPNFYGPYSGKVKHVLYYLNGSYITGYSSKDKKPFEELEIMFDGKIEIKNYLDQADNIAFKETANKTKAFLTGFYSAFGL
jgi:hypothetical protein